VAGAIILRDPGERLAAVVERLAVMVRANAGLEKFHGSRLSGASS